MEMINIYEALKMMRRFSEENIPFSMEFVSCDRSVGRSHGLVRVGRARLCQGLRDDQSRYSQSLVSYEDMDSGHRRQFWFPLLMRFNDKKITFERS